PARRLVQETIPRVARGGAEVFVRVNHDAELLGDDVEASLHSGLDGICFPKAESAGQIHQLESQILDIERRRGLPPGRVEIYPLIESPRGLLNVEAIATASPRIRSITLGPEDYCLALGVEPSADGVELLYGVSKLVTVSKAYGINPLGLLGSIAGFRDLDAFEQCAARARRLGCVGASCIHPDQVGVLNRVFSPTAVAVARARAAAEAFEAGLKQGTASVNLDGTMVDIPVYRRAKRVLEQVAAIDVVERRKAEAMARLQ
ncbi:MAG TPA: CoA ester lyase, partial [Candidatus Acidoferrum sp.]|nr:CoA ester lyase [Candidatus Acidoferrum sp.]